MEFDTSGMLKCLQDERNPPLETLLRDFSKISEGPEKAELHYTFVELHGIRKDAEELLDEDIIKPYLIPGGPTPALIPPSPMANEI